MKALLWIFLFFPVVLSSAIAMSTPDEEAEKIRQARFQEILDRALDEKGTREACKYISYISTPPPPMKVALTFDDGPSPTGTLHTLEVLRKYGIPGTFFMTGTNANRFPEIAERVADEGTLFIGNHSWNHPNFHTLSFEVQQNQILRARNVLEMYQAQTYFRFPYGNSTCDSIRFLHEEKHAIVGWHVDSCDWAYNRTGTVSAGDAKSCGVKPENRSRFVRHVVDSLKSRRGGILLMHETQPNTIARLEEIIDELRKEGFTFAPLNDPEFKMSKRRQGIARATFVTAISVRSSSISFRNCCRNPKNSSMEPSAPQTPQNPDRVKMVVYTKSLVQPPVMGSLVKQLEAQKGRIEYEILKDPALIRASIEKTNLTVLILTLNAKEELVDVLNVLTQAEARIQTGLLRALVLNGMNHPRVVALLKSKGVSEIIDFQVNIKALNHKIKNALLMVTQTHQRMSNQKMRASTVLGNGEAKRPRNEGGGNEITWDKPTEHPSDYWWLPNARNIRHVMGRWLIDILGPGPSAGYWEETTYDRNGERGWQWKIRVSSDPTYQPRAGRWLFFGKQPEFVWQKNLWSFVSKKPYFAFYAEGEKEPELVRFESLGTGKLRVHENSEVSQGFLPKIQASLEASLKLSKTEESSEVRGNFESSPESSSVSGGFSYGSGGGGSVGGGPAFRQGDLSADGPPADWNNHASAVGFGFKAKDIHIDQTGPKAKWRNALTPDEAIAGMLGLAEIRQVGVVSGARTFERLILNLRVRTKNGAEAAEVNPLRAIELTQNRAVFEMPNTAVKTNDRLLLDVEFRLADVEKKLELEWTCESLLPVEENRALVLGVLTGGNLVDWEEILRLAEQRHIELRDFFLVAKGA